MLTRNTAAVALAVLAVTVCAAGCSLLVPGNDGLTPDLAADAGPGDAAMSDAAFDACSPDPCANGGACVAAGAAFTCACDGTGYTGPTCMNAVACETLSPPTNGDVDPATGVFGDTAAYSCREGYVLTGNDGSNTRTCQADGSWSGSDAMCSEVITPCDPNPCLNGGACTLDGASFTCDCVGHTGATCATPIECPALSPPTNGSVDRTTVGHFEDAVSYSCDSFYYLAGNGGSPTRTCQSSGEWSGTALTCHSTGGYPMWPLPGTPGHPRDYEVRADTVLDRVTGLEWQQAVPSGTYTWADAVSYCDGLTLSTKTDWRLPSRIEILSIVDYSRYGPAVDPLIFPATPTLQFWTYSGSGVAGQWTIDFTEGYALRAPIANSYRARCVRGGTVMVAPITTHFSTAGGDDLLHGTTGLVWRRTVSASSFTHPSALTHCDTLGPDWRLSSILELMSIVDESREDPALDPSAFPTPGLSGFWSSTQLVGDSERAWRVEFYGGYTLLDDRGVPSSARCVR